MTSWKYRIVRYRDGSGYGLHEVFYDEGGNPTARTEEPIGFDACLREGPEEIARLLQQALEDAQAQSVLDEPERWLSEPTAFEYKIADPIPDVTDDPVERLLDKVGQAYQIIGYLVSGKSQRPSESEQIRALDYYADETAYDPDFLPWPRNSHVKQEQDNQA
ncbi:hypothetical protein [Microvirga sp. M2]|uniref:hypothetical protein n=1 Tax=Microvirga sp. M2 TaxID=3073270 RepID=UPI0039C3286C